MLDQKLKPLHFGYMSVGLLLAGLAAGLAIDVARDFMYPARVQPFQLEKRELALRGNLALERAVQDLKDSILRGDPAYSNDFSRHMEEVDRAAFQYRAEGTLDRQEEEALRKLHEAVPKYSAAIYTVHRMRASDASISEIDGTVKGEDRPISAAFGELETAVSDQDSPGRSLFRESVIVALCAVLAGSLLYFAAASPGRRREHASAHDWSLRELSNRIVGWEEEKEAKASSLLHDKVCQSLSAIMYLLKSAESSPSARSDTSCRSKLEPVIPSLQAAIRESLAIALDLRPPKLQESGLLGTLDSVWTDCQARRPTLEIVLRTRLHEEDIPEDLKPVILRVARMSSDWAVLQPATRQVRCELAREQDQLRLAIEVLFGREVLHGETSLAKAPADLADAIRARIVLSGGTSEGVQDMPEGQTILAIWRMTAPLTVRKTELHDPSTRSGPGMDPARRSSSTFGS